MAAGDEVVLALDAAANPKPPLIGLVIEDTAPDEVIVEWRNHQRNTYTAVALRKKFSLGDDEQYVGAWVQINAYQSVGFPKSPAAAGTVIDVIRTGAYDAQEPDETYLLVTLQDGRGILAVPLSQVTLEPGRRNV